MMSTTGSEPKPLLRGKNFHKKIQKEWCKTAEGNVEIEKSMTKISGRKGRMDIFIESDKKLVAIAEIKASDWDAMNPAAIRRNVKRQARQIWNYIESQLKFGKEVSPGVIFPKRTKNIDRMKLIEKLFDAERVSVVWEDESIAERKVRS